MQEPALLRYSNFNNLTKEPDRMTIYVLSHEDGVSFGSRNGFGISQFFPWGDGYGDLGVLTGSGVVAAIANGQASWAKGITILVLGFDSNDSVIADIARIVPAYYEMFAFNDKGDLLGSKDWWICILIL